MKQEKFRYQASMISVIDQGLGNRKKLRIALLALLLITSTLFLKTKEFDFINYDDDVYVLMNPDVKGISWQGIKKIFLNPDKQEEIKPPMTVLSLAVNYHFSQLNASSYHLTNLFLHLCNIILVFLVLKKATNSNLLPFLTAAFFAIHPFNVEPIAWISARKETQYAFFYLIALYFLLDYLKEKKSWQYLLILSAFLFSYYSKFAAITFPVLMIALSLIWQKRRDYIRVGLESIPFLFIPLYSYLKPIFTRNDFQANVPIAEVVEAGQQLNFHHNFLWFEKFILGGYSFVQYLFKYLFPYKLRLIYPYPLKVENSLPMEYYLLALTSIILIASVVYLYFRKKLYNKRALNFGLIFFFVHISLLLHILPIGGRVIMAERYLYLPQIGLLLLLVYLIIQAFEKYPSKKNTLLLGLLAFFGFYVFQSYSRLPEWKNSITILSDLIEKEPNYPLAYNNLALEYLKQNDFQSAPPLLNKALELNPLYFEATNNLASCYLLSNKPQLAEKFYKRVLEMDNNFADGHYNLGKIYYDQGNMDKAMEHYQRTVEISPNHALGHNNIGNIYLKQDSLELAFEYFSNTIKYDPKYPIGYYNRGIACVNAWGDHQSAIRDFDMVAKLDPQNVNVYINRANSKYKLEDYNGAINDFTSAINLAGNNAPAYFFINRAAVYFLLNLDQQACNDLRTAVAKGSPEAQNMLRMNCFN